MANAHRPSNLEPADEGGRIHVLYDPRDHGHEQPGSEIDIVAIHGENGHWRQSWTSGGSGPSYFWLLDAIPQKFRGARVISCEHGGVRENIIENLLWDLIDDRIANSRSHVPLVIIAHSFGGTLAKQLFTASSPSRNSWPEVNVLHSCMKGYMFFGTVQVGGPSEDMRRMAGFAAPLLRVTRSMNYHLDLLHLISFLDQITLINQDFESSGGLQVPTVCFYESQPIRVGFGPEITLVPREKAILQQAENRAINSNHSEMIKFKNPSDPSLTRVMGSLDRLISNAREWGGVTLHRTQQLEPHAEGIRILSLDGGGVKGLFSALVLEAVMEAVRQIDTPNNPDAPKPCDYFDFICGTSTGGLLAIMLGRLRMDVRSCTLAYHGLSRDIFEKTVWSFPGKKWWDAYWDKPWFSGRKLEGATKGLLAKYLTTQEKDDLESRGIDPRDAPLRPTGSQDATSTCHSFVCALPEGQRQCHRFRSYLPSSNLPGTDCAIWEAARATSAAPLYFPPMSIGGCAYFDGGMASNNPILEAVREAGQEYPTHPIAAIVSIGAGSSAPSSPRGGLVSLVNSVVQRVTDTEAKHNEFLEQFPGLRNSYFRLQEEDRLGAIDLAAWERLDEIKQLSLDYLRSTQGQLEIRKCAEKVARNGGVREN